VKQEAPPSKIRKNFREGWFTQAHSGEYRRRALWENLPKKMMYQTFKTIIDYLEESGKIAADIEKKICWIHNPDLVRKYALREDLRVR